MGRKSLHTSASTLAVCRYFVSCSALFDPQRRRTRVFNDLEVMNDRPTHRIQYRATVGERTIELELGPDEVMVDGRTRSFSSARLPAGRISLIIDGRSHSADVHRAENGHYVVHLGGHEFDVSLKTERDLLLERFGLADTATDANQQIRAPMPGLVLSLHVEIGAAVSAGDAIMVLEAMKMENELRAPIAGVVKSVHVATGDAVGKNDLLVEIEA